MTKHEKQQLTTLCCYLNDATVWHGVAAATKAHAGLHILLAETQNPPPLTRKACAKT